MRDAVDNDVVAFGLLEGDGSGDYKFGFDAMRIARIDVLNERARKTVLRAKEHTNPLHCLTVLLSFRADGRNDGQPDAVGCAALVRRAARDDQHVALL